MSFLHRIAVLLTWICRISCSNVERWHKLGGKIFFSFCYTERRRFIAVKRLQLQFVSLSNGQCVCVCVSVSVVVDTVRLAVETSRCSSDIKLIRLRSSLRIFRASETERRPVFHWWLNKLNGLHTCTTAIHSPTYWSVCLILIWRSRKGIPTIQHRWILSAVVRITETIIRRDPKIAGGGFYSFTFIFFHGLELISPEECTVIRELASCDWNEYCVVDGPGWLEFEYF